MTKHRPKRTQCLDRTNAQVRQSPSHPDAQASGRPQTSMGAA